MNKKKFMLTFDVEQNFPPYGNGYEGVKKALPKIIDILDEMDVHSTMFVTGRTAELYPKIIKRASKNHEIQCHTYNHEVLDELKKKDQMNSIQKCKEILELTTGKKIYGFRAPYLRFNEDTMEVLHELGFRYDSSILVKGMIGKSWYAVKKINRNILDLIFNPDEKITDFYVSMTKFLKSTKKLENMTKTERARFFYYIMNPFQSISKNTEDKIKSLGMQEVKINLRSIYMRLPIFNASMLKSDIVVSYLHPWEFIELEKYINIKGILIFDWLFSGEKLLNALRSRIKNIMENGYKFVTISEYLGLDEKQI